MSLRKSLTLACVLGATTLMLLAGMGRINPADAIARMSASLVDGGVTHLATIGTSGHGSARGQFDAVGPVASDGSGGFFVFDRNNMRIQRWCPNDSSASVWSWRRQWNTTSSGYRYYDGMGSSSEYLYRVDSRRSVIYQYQIAGPAERTWGTVGSGPGQLSWPTDVCVDPSGAVLVADQGNHRISRYSWDGYWQDSFNLASSGYPMSISAGPSGDVFVTNPRASEIQRFDNNGTFLNKWSVGSSGYGGIAVDKYGYVYYCNTRSSCVEKYESDGTPAGQFGESSSGSGALSAPIDVAVDANLRVFVSDYGNNRIEVYRTVRHWLSKVSVGTKVMRKGKSIALSGTMKPAHPAGSVIKIHAQRFSSGGSKKGSPIIANAVVVSSSGSSCRWIAQVKLPRTGYWKFKAFAASDGLHLPGESSAWSSRVTVK